MKSTVLKRLSRDLTHTSLPLSGIVVVLFCTAAPQLAFSQQALQEGKVNPMGRWVEYVEANYQGEAIRIHLRTGYERAVVFPEPVRQLLPDQQLPGCEVLINDNVVAFYPEKNLERTNMVFTGELTGVRYEIIVRASSSGIRKPLRING